jgi:hypothetical protein
MKTTNLDLTNIKIQPGVSEKNGRVGFCDRKPDSKRTVLFFSKDSFDFCLFSSSDFCRFKNRRQGKRQEYKGGAAYNYRQP